MGTPYTTGFMKNHTCGCMGTVSEKSTCSIPMKTLIMQKLYGAGGAPGGFPGIGGEKGPSVQEVD